MNDPNISNLSKLADLSDLLVTTVQAVVKSQETLDDYTRRRQEEYNTTPDGELAIPPLWYAITNVAVELELSVSVSEERVVNSNGVESLRSHLNCNTLNPLSVGLFGYQASAGLRVRLQLGPRGILPYKSRRLNQLYSLIQESSALMPPSPKIISGPELLKNLAPLSEKQALVINAKVFGTIDTDNSIVLSKIPNPAPLGSVMVGYQNSFGVLDFTPVDLAEIVMLPIFTSTLVIFHGYAGVFVNADTVLLQDEIKKGERMFSLKQRALIVSEGRYGFAPIPESLTDERDKIIADLRLENGRLQQENTALRQQLGDVPNLRVQIETLKTMVATRDQDILTLKAQIQQMIETAKRTPDDFATAVSGSVDKLQTRLAGLTNPTSDFVVREFNLDAKVYIDVNEQGQIDYRFIRPGDNVDPQKVSNLSLKLMPVPKQENPTSPTGGTPASTTPPATFTGTGALPPIGLPSTSQPSGGAAPSGLRPNPSPETSKPLAGDAPNSLPGQDLPMESIAGLGTDLQDRLSQNNIHTLAEFLQAATRARTIAAFSAILDVDRQRLGNWVMQAQLMTLGGITAGMAQALIDFGITSLRAMAGANSEKLLAEYNAQALANEVPAATLADVQRWIATARLSLGGK